MLQAVRSSYDGARGRLSISADSRESLGGEPEAAAIAGGYAKLEEGEHAPATNPPGPKPMMLGSAASRVLGSFRKSKPDDLLESSLRGSRTNVFDAAVSDPDGPSSVGSMGASPHWNSPEVAMERVRRVRVPPAAPAAHH